VFSCDELDSLLGNDDDNNECGDIDYFQYYLDSGIIIPEEYIFDSNDLLTIDTYDVPYDTTRNTELTSSIEDAYNFFEANQSPYFENWFVMLSSPHSQRMIRYIEIDDVIEVNEHKSDKYTGAIAEFMHFQLGVPVICSKYKSDDPNYYNIIPDSTQTQLFIENNYIGNDIPFKQKLSEYILADNNVINLVIDLHGFDSNNLRADIMIGTIDGNSLQTNLGCYVPEIIASIFEANGIDDIPINAENYTAGINQTVTKYVVNNISKNSSKILDALQMEIDIKYRFQDDTEEDYTEYRVQFIKALAEIIYVLNHLYNAIITIS